MYKEENRREDMMIDLIVLLKNENFVKQMNLIKSRTNINKELKQYEINCIYL